MNTHTEQQHLMLDGLCMPGTDVVAVDLIALVAGVNFNSVRKVVAALHALTGCGLDLSDLLCYAAMPEQVATPARFQQTRALAQRLAGYPALQDSEPRLHFVERLGRYS